jgi:Holliday junction DNA helicase RuvA
MIAHLRGTLVSVTPSCVVSVGGVGFEVQIAGKDRNLLVKSSGEIVFHTYLHVREDSLTLFGFLEREDREFFTRLIEVSGIGPKIALGIVGDHPVQRIIAAVRSEDHGFLRTLPGLGRKTAERLVIELRDKLGAFEEQESAEAMEPTVREEAVLALVSLGMSRMAAERALEMVDLDPQETPSVESIVKRALRMGSSV